MAAFGAVLIGLGFIAVSTVSHDWAPLDYWLTWFAVFASVLGLICLVIGIFSASVTVSEICDGR